MKVMWLDKVMAENKELRKKYPRGIARILKRFYSTCYCSLTPWEMIENAELGDTINVPYFNDGFEHSAYGPWMGRVGVPMTDEKLEREGWCTTKIGTELFEKMEEEIRKQIVFERKVVNTLYRLRKVCEKRKSDWSKVVGKSLL